MWPSNSGCFYISGFLPEVLKFPNSGLSFHYLNFFEKERQNARNTSCNVFIFVPFNITD